MTSHYPAKILVCRQSSQVDQKKLLIQYLTAEYQISSLNSPQLDLINQEQETLTIDMVRQLKQQAAFANYQNQTRFFCFLAADQATIPAQNALLKLIEEPPAKSHCLLIVTNYNQLLPTIQSRCLRVNLTVDPADLPPATANEFLNQFFAQPQKYNYSQIIDWAGQYKDRQQATEIIKMTLATIIKKPYNNRRTQLLALDTLKKILLALDKNLNVRLCLEKHLFFVKNK